MTHVRSTIRHAFTEVLGSGLDTERFEVLGRRAAMRNRVDAESLVDVRFGEVAVTQETMGDMRTHTATLMIRVQHEGTEENLDDLLDEDEVLVCALIDNHDWSSLLEEEPELQQISFARDAESEVAVGVIILQFRVEYRIDKRDPETVRT